MLLVGLTGGIATGKSSCSARFAQTKGVTVIDCDGLVHELQRPGGEAVLAIKKAFPTVVSADNVLDRAALGQIIFADAAKRRTLAGIMNKLIFIAIVKLLVHYWWTKPRDHIVILDAPTLYESKMFVYIVSSVIVVACSEEKQLSRLMARNNFTREEALVRMKSQISIEEKKRRADLVMENSEDGVENLDAKVADAVGWIRRTQGASKVPLLIAGTIAVFAIAAYAGVALPLAIYGKLIA